MSEMCITCNERLPTNVHEETQLKDQTCLTSTEREGESKATSSGIAVCQTGR